MKNISSFVEILIFLTIYCIMYLVINMNTDNMFYIFNDMITDVNELKIKLELEYTFINKN